MVVVYDHTVQEHHFVSSGTLMRHGLMASSRPVVSRVTLNLKKVDT